MKKMFVYELLFPIPRTNLCSLHSTEVLMFFYFTLTFSESVLLIILDLTIFWKITLFLVLPKNTGVVYPSMSINIYNLYIKEGV